MNFKVKARPNWTSDVLEPRLQFPSLRTRHVRQRRTSQEAGTPLPVALPVGQVLCNSLPSLSRPVCVGRQCSDKIIVRDDIQVCNIARAVIAVGTHDSGRWAVGLSQPTESGAASGESRGPSTPAPSGSKVTGCMWTSNSNAAGRKIASSSRTMDNGDLAIWACEEQECCQKQCCQNQLNIQQCMCTPGPFLLNSAGRGSASYVAGRVVGGRGL
ncbi:hypothetical protein FIBSPDRAFT_887153 [Athelia psychrophila]|uniref:Uncharacterized protein n=1 Tax=Athelia psychrophila TaxID=1759441 RepID=A0A166Q1C6_9AGAM|nr:hypothetical protein FIBSPDRAFT_887153 [Fibularhizoctonia sp. CBS 109695]